MAKVVQAVPESTWDRETVDTIEFSFISYAYFRDFQKK